MSFDEPVATEIDGVKVWYTDVPGPCLAGLVFRSGFVDETLSVHGINHIVEHLALFPLWDPDLAINGAVEGLTTRFTVAGTQDEAEGFLAQVCRTVSSIPLDRLDQERSVLETEARRGMGGSFAGTASARFGARGIGLADWFEFGIRGLGPDELRAWTEERFTSGQAEVFMTRPPTSSLRLELPPGPRLPIPVPEPLPRLTVPSHVHSFEAFLGCSLAATRSLPLFVATLILHERLIATLRRDRALSYSASRVEERIAPLQSLYMIFVDSTEGMMQEAVLAFDEILRQVADEVSPEEIERAHRSAMPWNSAHPARPAAEAARKCVASLMGREPTTWKGLEKQGERLTPEKVCSAIREALETAIFVAPEGVMVPPRYRPHPEPKNQGPPVEGRVYVRWDGSRGDETTMSRRGVTRRTSDQARWMRFDDVEVAVFGPGGTIYLIDRVGRDIEIEPNELMRGKELAALLKEWLADRVVDMHRDVIGWFEFQTLVENHDGAAVGSIWRQIEMIAQTREPGERILAIAVGDANGRAVIAVTDRRVILARTGRSGSEVAESERTSIRSVETTAGLLGSKLEIAIDGDTVYRVDRIRPRGHASQIEQLLAPLEEPPPE